MPAAPGKQEAEGASAVTEAEEQQLTLAAAWCNARGISPSCQGCERTLARVRQTRDLPVTITTRGPLCAVCYNRKESGSMGTRTDWTEEFDGMPLWAWAFYYKSQGEGLAAVAQKLSSLSGCAITALQAKNTLRRYQAQAGLLLAEDFSPREAAPEAEQPEQEEQAEEEETPEPEPQADEGLVTLEMDLTSVGPETLPWCVTLDVPGCIITVQCATEATMLDMIEAVVSGLVGVQEATP